MRPWPRHQKRLEHMVDTPITEPGDREGARGVFEHPEDRVRAGSLGLLLLLITLGMLFGALALLYVAVRLDTDAWPSDLPSIPWQTWVSTAVLLAISVLLAEAVSADRRGSQSGVTIGLITSGLLALVFLALQVWAGAVWWWAAPEQGSHVALTGFWVLSGVHVAHVLGGLIPLAILIGYALTRCWTTARRGLLAHTAIYWHFLDAVWILLLITMLVVLR